ncbi:MAG: nucleotidyl transferase AbiEii/AbiGii toxin family protein [Acidobacteria bacterium]|nr:nucleotidyl transferase AbiEii/AbiGii toxin family protein [Acidobacteriota bacterium]
MATRIRNVSASVLARLLERAKRTGDDYQALLSAFASERFLYRLSLSSAADRYVLKGAMLLRVWSDQPYRATRDLDLLRLGASEALDADIETICGVAVEDDGLVLDASRIRIESIRDEAR